MGKHAGTPAAGWLDRAIALAPLVALPFVLNVRVFPFVAPNEEPKWAIYGLAGFGVLGLAAARAWVRGLTLVRSWAFWGVVAFVALAFVGVFRGVNRTEGWIRFAAWVDFFAVMFAAAWAMRALPRWDLWLARALIAAGTWFSLGYWKGYFLDYGKPGYNIMVLFSPVGHVNFTADVLVVWIPAMAWALVRVRTPVERVLAWFALFTEGVVLLVGASRGGMFGVWLGFALAALLALRAGRIKAAARRPEAWWCLSAAAASVVVYFMLPFHYREAARLSGTLKAAAEIPKEAKLTPGVPQPPLAELWIRLYPVLGDRTPMYASTWAMVMDRPWLGHGTGNFAWIYPKYSNHFPDFRDRLSSARTFTTNPHDYFLQIASENGIPAALIFTALLLWAWARFARAAWQQGTLMALMGAAAVAAAGFDALFNHVFFNPASLYMFALVIGAWLGGVVSFRTRALGSLASRLVGAGLAGAAVANVWIWLWVASEWHVGRAMQLERVPGMAAAAAREYDKAYRLDPENFRAVFGVGAMAYRMGDFAKAERVLRAFQRIYPYNPPAINLLGAALMQQGKLAEARKYFALALEVLPDFEAARQNLRQVEMLLRLRARPR